MAAQSARLTYARIIDDFDFQLSALRGLVTLLTTSLGGTETDILIAGSEGVICLCNRQVDELDRAYQALCSRFEAACPSEPDEARVSHDPGQENEVLEKTAAGVDVEAIAQSLNVDRAVVAGVLRQLTSGQPATKDAGGKSKGRSRAVNG